MMAGPVRKLFGRRRGHGLGHVGEGADNHKSDSALFLRRRSWVPRRIRTLGVRIVVHISWLLSPSIAQVAPTHHKTQPNKFNHIFVDNGAGRSYCYPGGWIAEGHIRRLTQKFSWKMLLYKYQRNEYEIYRKTKKTHCANWIKNCNAGNWSFCVRIRLL